MANNQKIAVTTVAFSKNEFLRKKLLEVFPKSKFNDEFKRFTKDELKDFLKDVDGAIVGLDTVDEELLSSVKDLHWIRDRSPRDRDLKQSSAIPECSAIAFSGSR